MKEFGGHLSRTQRAAILDLLKRLTAEFDGKIIRVLPFGSVARGDAGPDSDIDILLVAEGADWEFKWQARGLGADVSQRNGVLFNLHIRSLPRWQKMERRQTALWRNIRREAIDLSPQPVADPPCPSPGA